jgi:isoquinoline 1-oxidoreductase beta subunit
MLSETEKGDVRLVMLKLDRMDRAFDGDPDMPLLGGGFGRKSKPDYVAEAAVLAALLSKELGRPVKVVWTREDDVKFDDYNALAAMYMKAAVDDKGKPTAQRSVFPPIASIFDVNAVYGDPPHLATSLS